MANINNSFTFVLHDKLLYNKVYFYGRNPSVAYLYRIQSGKMKIVRFQLLLADGRKLIAISLQKIFYA
jgi:ribose/xylose/arabinose/galactoside ABC-type transport system permease subunit